MRPARRATRIALEAVAAVSLLVSLLPFVAAQWWVFDLFTHFRLQLICVQLLLLIGLGLLARSVWSPILALLLGANLYASQAYWLPDRSPDTIERDLRIMAANVRAENEHADGLLAQIDREQPDVVAIVEFNASWAARLEPLHRTFPYRIEVPRADHFGIALFARRPILGQRLLDLDGTPAIDAEIDAASGVVRVVAVHLVPPMSQHAAAQQRRQRTQLARHVATGPRPLIVIGDLNMTPYSPNFAELLAPADLHDALTGYGPRITWPTFLPLLGIPIDHCLLSTDWDSIAYRRQPAYGSDHFAIAVDLIEKAS